MTDSANLLLHYRPELGILVACWQGESDAAPLRSAYDAVLAALVRHHTPRALLDLRRRNVLHPDMTHWFNTNWLPRAVSAVMPGQLRLAYLISPLRAQAMEQEQAAGGAPKPRREIALRHDVEIFTDEAAARRWLLEA